MSQIGSMFQHGNSIGAAFSLLIFGAGINLGILLCFFHLFGPKRVLAFLVLLAFVSLGLAYLISEPLFPKGVEVAGHTHAFDVYTNPFAGQTDYAKSAWSEMRRFRQQNEIGGTYILIGMIVVGLLFHLVQSLFPLTNWVTSKAPQLKRDLMLPDWVIAAVSLLGLLAFSVAGCFIYYPPPAETLEQMKHANLDVSEANLGRWDLAIRGIEAQTSWSRSLEVGTFIRTGKLSEYHRIKAQILRDRLEHLRHAVEDQDPVEVKRLVRECSIAYRRLGRAFLNNGAQ
jgi:hypothetical protein